MPTEKPPVILLGKRPAQDLQKKVARGESPRLEYAVLAERIGATILDHHSAFDSSHPLVRLFTKWLGPNYGLAMLGYLRRDEFSDFYLTGEDVAIPLGALFRVRGVKRRITAVVHNAETPKRLKIFRALGHHIFRNIIVLGAAQKDVFTGKIGFPEEKLRQMFNWIDERFYTPVDHARGDYVVSVGMENRDYPTLQKAALGLPIPFQVVGSGWSPGAGFAPAAGLAQQANFTLLSGLSWDALRALYAQARFVVVPINAVSYAAGVTSILEAYAMGKAVVATASPGIMDYVQDNVSGRVTPVGDVDALRAAIQDLYAHPDRAHAMGKRNRVWLESTCITDRYAESVAQLLGIPRHVPGNVQAGRARDQALAATGARAPDRPAP